MVPGRRTAGLARGPALRGAGACCSPLVWPRPGPDAPSTVTLGRALGSWGESPPPQTGVSSLVCRTPSAPLIGTRPPSPAAPVPFHPLPPMVGAVRSRHPLQLPRADGAPLSAIRSGGDAGCSSGSAVRETLCVLGVVCVSGVVMVYIFACVLCRGTKAGLFFPADHMEIQAGTA